MPCVECQGLESHAFRSPDDLVHALRVAAEEMDRGVLEPEGGEQAGLAEMAAVRSALLAGELPRSVRYSFRCAVCGDRFALVASSSDGSGEWRRESNA